MKNSSDEEENESLVGELPSKLVTQKPIDPTTAASGSF